MTNSTHTPPPGPEQDTPGADRFTQRLGESAHQVWLAGLGAFNRAQVEGSRFFDSLVRDGDHLRLRVADDGVGLAAANDARAAGGGAGMASMRLRAQRLGGQLKMRDAAPGTELHLQLPLAA